MQRLFFHIILFDVLNKSDDELKDLFTSEGYLPNAPTDIIAVKDHYHELIQADTEDILHVNDIHSKTNTRHHGAL